MRFAIFVMLFSALTLTGSFSRAQTLTEDQQIQWLYHWSTYQDRYEFHNFDNETIRRNLTVKTPVILKILSQFPDVITSAHVQFVMVQLLRVTDRSFFDNKNPAILKIAELLENSPLTKDNLRYLEDVWLKLGYHDEFLRTKEKSKHVKKYVSEEPVTTPEEIAALGNTLKIVAENAQKKPTTENVRKLQRIRALFSELSSSLREDAREAAKETPKLAR